MASTPPPARDPTASAIERLSPRQREILELLARGLTNDEIGSALEISPTTVRTHVTAVLSELEVSNRTEATAVFVAWEARPQQVAQILARPALVVLPLRAVGEHPRVRVLAEGMGYDLVSLFSRWCWFPVVTPRPGEPVGEDPRELGRLLGARFAVSGSLQLAASARLHVRIDDTETGHALWTERFDFVPDELFAVQDSVCERVVAAAYPVLISRLLALAGRAPRALNAGAWELAHEGMALQAVRDRSSNLAARDRFTAALELDPTLVLAHFGLGLAAFDEVLNQWGEPQEGRRRLLDAADRCVTLAPHAAEGFYLIGRHLQTQGEPDGAASALEKAVGNNPSFAAAYALLAQILHLAGRRDEGLVRMQQAVRLGPRSFVAGLATMRFMRGDYAEALVAAEEAVALKPGYTYPRALAAASAWWLGDGARAKSHASMLQTEHGDFDVDALLNTFGTGLDAVERLARALYALRGS